MSIYRVKVGHDQPLLDLVALDPQPMSPGLHFTVRRINADRSRRDIGPYIPLLWNVMGGASVYNAILTQFGLKTATVNEVTVYARDEFLEFHRFNVLAVRPEMGVDARWRNYFLHDIALIVEVLSKLEEPP